MIITEDEFALWQVNPVTHWVMAALRRAMDQERAEWLRQSWDAAPPDGRTSPAVLIELRTRHDAFSDVVTNDFDTWSEWNAKPERD